MNRNMVIAHLLNNDGERFTKPGTSRGIHVGVFPTCVVFGIRSIVLNGNFSAVCQGHRTDRNEVLEIEGDSALGNGFTPIENNQPCASSCHTEIACSRLSVWPEEVQSKGFQFLVQRGVEPGARRIAADKKYRL